MDMKKKIEIKKYNDIRKVISRVKKVAIFTFVLYMVVGSTKAYTEAEMKNKYDNEINGMKIQTEQLLNENGFEWNGTTVQDID